MEVPRLGPQVTPVRIFNQSAWRGWGGLVFSEIDDFHFGDFLGGETTKYSRLWSKRRAGNKRRPEFFFKRNKCRDLNKHRVLKILE